MRRLLLLLLIFTTNSLFSEGLVKVNINDLIDNNSISHFTSTDSETYFIFNFDFYKWDISNKILELVYTAPSGLLSVNYFDSKFYVNTFDDGTIVLDSNFNFIRDYTMENTNLKYLANYKSIKGLNDDIFILNEGSGLLRITKDTTIFYDINSFLRTNHIYDMIVHNGKYYFALSGVPCLITDENFNILDTVDLKKIMSFESYNCDKVFVFDKYIIWESQWNGYVLNNTENNTYSLISIETHKIQNYSATNFLYDDNKLFICNAEGLYIYNPDTGEEKAYRITKEPTNGMSPSPNTIIDIVKIEETYYVTTRNGIYYLDETQSGLIKLETTSNQLFSINSNTFISNNSLKLEIFDLNSKLIYDGNFNEGNTLNLRDILKANSVYFIKATNDNKTESSKFILSDI